ncbi:MAG: hypothetical protein GY832_25650 [Chloroflexi bacterium]|nr:hypothetical protein [Chloroflexota bacterium]
MPELTPREQEIFAQTLKTGDWDIFTQHYFQLPKSGTWYTPEDRVEQYQRLHEAWVSLGKPDTQMFVEVDGVETAIHVSWDYVYYGDDPLFLLPHGFRMLPWLREFLAPSIPLGIAITGTGTGKAQNLDAKILTPKGWTTMGDIKKGDCIIGQDGSPKKVLGVYPQGIRPIYRVTFSDGSSTTADDEHLWLVDDGRKRKNSSWRVMETGELLTVRQRNFIPFVEPVEYASSQNLPMDPYLLGALLGDGGLTQDTVMFTNPDDEVLDRVRNAIPEELHLKYSSNYDYRISRKVLKGTRYNPLITTLRDLGLWGHGADGKFIPDSYLYASYEDRVAILQGLLDTDGCVAGLTGGIEYVTVSQALAYNIQELVWSLGGKVSIATKRPTYIYNGERRSGKTAYRLYIQFHKPSFSPFYLSRKADNYRSKCTRLTRRVVSVEYIGDMEAQCINVEDNLYVTDDYIVTHNTAGTAIFGLMCCALLPGFRFLNVAPTSEQAGFMLAEIEKWAGNTGFRKFIRESRGANPLWKEKPHPTVVIEVYEGYPSLFVCQIAG